MKIVSYNSIMPYNFFGTLLNIPITTKILAADKDGVIYAYLTDDIQCAKTNGFWYADPVTSLPVGRVMDFEGIDWTTLILEVS